ncbi:MAG: TolC family outer membrane protein [Magnetococcales bacterium]|nr:TolC family outer membrane protein [Magnetococcales bacterium]
MVKSGIVLIGLCALMVTAQASGVGSFVESVQAALQKHPRTLAAAAQLRAAREKHQQSRALLLPGVELSATRTRHQLEWPGNSAGSDPLSLNLSLTQAVFNRKALIGLAQSRPYIAAWEFDLQWTIQGVFLETASVLVELLQAMEVRRLASNNRDLLRHHLEETRARFKVGQLTGTDVSQGESRLALAEANLVRAANSVAVGRSRFREMTGEAASEGLALPGLREGVLTGTLEQLLARGASRPDLEAARLRVQVAGGEVEMKRAAHWPTVALTARAGRGWGEEIGGTTDPVDRYEVGVGVSLPVFSGGMTVSETAEALARKEGLDAELERLQRLMEREVESAFLELQSVQAAEASLQSALRAAEAALKGVEQEFKVGTRTSLDLLDARNDLFSARTELAKSGFAMVLARFRLLSSLGELTTEALHH